MRQTSCPSSLICTLSAVVSLFFVSACKPQQHADPPPQPDTNSLSAVLERDAEWDATVWREEVAAQHYEKTLVALADGIRRADDKAAVLANLPFETIRIPKAKGAPNQLPLNIQLQNFEPEAGIELTHSAWQKAINRFQQTGWKLIQIEWQHEKFTPATNSALPVSNVAFELHGEQSTNRFILKGNAQIEWSGMSRSRSNSAGGVLPKPKQITIANLSLLERSGPPGFNNHLLIAPEPEEPRGQVNMHPLIVTDMNGDGHDDIVLPGVNKLLLNDGKANFQALPFIKEQNFMPLKEVGLIEDFNGDGKLDFISVAEMGPLAKMLIVFFGDGSLPFSAPAVAAWEAQRSNFAAYKMEAASVITAGDIDGDGDLDVFVAQYRPPYVRGNLPTPYYDANDGYASYLLINDGHGKFQLAPPQPALLAKRNRRTLAASFVDLDNDGDLDLVTMNDFSGVDLYYNDGKGSFTDQTARLDNRHLFGMGHCFADFDRDGILDFFGVGMSIPTVHRLDAMGLVPKQFPELTARRSDMAYGNRLYLARSGRWVEPDWAAQVARSGWSWGVSAFDFDNNGWLDIYLANGHVSGESSADYDNHYWTHDIYIAGSSDDRQRQQYFETALGSLNKGKTSWNGYQHNTLFLDYATNQYVNVAFLMGVAHASDCRAVVAADLNEDGRIDLLLTEAKWVGSPNIMRHRLLGHFNELETANHWIGVKLASTNGRCSTIGAKVRAKAGDRTYIAQIVTGDSFQAQHPNTVHFGLGAAKRVDELQVIWPDRHTNIMVEPAVDRYHQINR